MAYWDYEYPRYVSVAERRAKAMKELAKLAKDGHVASPVTIAGNKIVRTFWGTAWCGNLEAYSDFASRLPRGRSYVRNGSVVDLKIEAGEITAMVMGSELYEVTIKIDRVATAAWKDVKGRCSGQIGSLVELLQGKLSKSVMEIVTCRDRGLFPKPKEIDMDCSCPDHAGMCKHIAAVMYGIGARLDDQPELLFKLRQVDHLELITEAADVGIAGANAGDGERVTIEAGALSDVFGIEFETPVEAPVAAPVAPKKPTRKKAEKKKVVKKKTSRGRKP